jgi:hypothetical protein
MITDTVITGGEGDCNLTLWSLNGERIGEYDRHVGAVTVLFSSDKHDVISADSAGNIIVWVPGKGSSVKWFHVNQFGTLKGTDEQFMKDYVSVKSVWVSLSTNSIVATTNRAIYAWVRSFCLILHPLMVHALIYYYNLLQDWTTFEPLGRMDLPVGSICEGIAGVRTNNSSEAVAVLGINEDWADNYYFETSLLCE